MGTQQVYYDEDYDAMEISCESDRVRFTAGFGEYRGEIHHRYRKVEDVRRMIQQLQEWADTHSETCN